MMKRQHRPRRAGRSLFSFATSLALLLIALTGYGCAANGTADADFESIRSARYVLLGEVHDNPTQHRLRAELIARLLADGRPTRVVFEQIDRGHDAEIAAAIRSPKVDSEEVATAAALDRRGWGWPLHKPIFDVVLAGDAEIVGGNLERDVVRRLARGRAAALPSEVTGLLERTPWSIEDEARLEQEIDIGHCRALPASALPALARAQRARDASLAAAMLSGAPRRVVLVAGNGHVGSNRGVPRYLRAAGVAPSTIVSVGYLERDGAEAPDRTAYDLVRITPATARPDPCADFRAQPPSQPASASQ